MKHQATPLSRLIIRSLILAATTLTLQAETTTVYFRVLAPVAATLTRIDGSGSLTWTNPVQNTTCDVQIATSLAGGGNWRDHTHVVVTSAVTSTRVFNRTQPSNLSYIPAGVFKMGDSTSDHPTDSYHELEEAPIHPIQLDAFHISKLEITKAEWDTVVSWAVSHGYVFDCAGNGKSPSHPVAAVCWYDVVRWCNAKSEKEGLTPCYYTDEAQTVVFRSGISALSSTCVKWSASGYRLPTEAEWEYAARGGQQGARFDFGGSITHTQANYFSTNTIGYDVSSTKGLHPDHDDGSPCSCAAGTFPANNYGLHEVAGNVSEWCWDRSDGVSTSCGPCGGDGLIPCSTCAGAGNIACSTCSGAGVVSCGDCDGNGTNDIPCGACTRGPGIMDCTNCFGATEILGDCTTCGADGLVPCPPCSGSGKKLCSGCSGAGRFLCTSCGGAQYVQCSSCSGIGDFSCSDCDGNGCELCEYSGRIPCGSCLGSKIETCYGCAGNGFTDCFDCLYSPHGPGWVDCLTCSGTKEVSCDPCSGTGSRYFPCSPCRATGGITCQTCKGVSTLKSVCLDCSGSGHITCSSCIGGKTMTCTFCAGAKTESCFSCTGLGDIWTSDYYTRAAALNPRGPTEGEKRIFRGGAWDSNAEQCRLAHRADAIATEVNASRGFRTVKAAIE